MQLKLSSYKGLAVAVIAGVVAVGSVYWVVTSLRGRVEAPTFYFTNDDGQSFFTLRSPQIPPFDHEGREAVQAIVYEGSDGRPFVGCLFKYTTQGKEAMLRRKQGGWGSAAGGAVPMVTPDDELYKRPGQEKWIPNSDPGATELMNVLDPKTNQPARPWSQ